MKNNNCCICGLVKDCEPYLSQVINNIKQISAIFTKYKIIFSYDISSDKSLDILENYRLTDPNNVEIIIGTEPLTEYRVKNIAKARNRCLRKIQEKYNDYEYFIMIDCDDKGGTKINIKNLEYYLQDSTILDSWDSLTFNRKPYYDLWALSIYPYSFGCMHFANWSKWGQHIKHLLLTKKPMELIECFSAFNGFGIYKTNKFINCYYDFRPRLDLIGKELLAKNIEVAGPIYFRGKACKIDCEHRSFHYMAIKENGAKIRIANAILFS